MRNKWRRKTTHAFKTPYYGPFGTRPKNIHDRKNYIFANTKYYKQKKQIWRFLSELLTDFPIELVQDGKKMFIVFYGDIKISLTKNELFEYYYHPSKIFRKFLHHTFLRPEDFSKWFLNYVGQKKYEKVSAAYRHYLFNYELSRMYKKVEPLFKTANPEMNFLINLMWHKNKDNGNFPLNL